MMFPGARRCLNLVLCVDPPCVSRPTQPLSSYHIDALASRLSPGTKDICRDKTTTSFLINASIHLVKGGRLGLMPGVLFHSCHPSFPSYRCYVPGFCIPYT